jgi:hypothetical protein
VKGKMKSKRDRVEEGNKESFKERNEHKRIESKVKLSL